jgi:hypothetical protein
MTKPYISEPPKTISDFAKEFDFKNLRTYYDSETGEVMQRIAHHPSYLKAMAYFWPEVTEQQAIEKALGIKSAYEFQKEYMNHAIWSIIHKSSTGLTYSGIEHLDKNKAYLFVANHRDVLLDTAILQIILVKEGHSTSEITFGSNLMDEDFIKDFVSMNRMFTIQREGSAKELYAFSRQLSAYIRHTIIDKNVSVWIAQRNGRTKDGNDSTQTGLLKMLNLSGGKDFEKSFSELNIVPLTISFEYEPCDVLKVQETYFTQLANKYVKAPGEDLMSVFTGVKQPKGKIHVAFGKPIDKELSAIAPELNENEKIKVLTSIIDKEIHQNYQLNAVNFIAYDLLKETTRFEDKYSATEKAEFIIYINVQLAKINGKYDVLKNLFLKMYANPVINKLGL